LSALGCDEVQGYLFSPPVPLDKLDELLAKRTPEKVLAA
jgi:EAL domain-containing protein (putative c-di-GMP-specific phosphodiesterase class I)